MPLEQLPVEILIQIGSYLCARDLLSWMRTARPYASMLTDQFYGQTLRDDIRRGYLGSLLRTVYRKELHAFKMFIESIRDINMEIALDPMPNDSGPRKTSRILHFLCLESDGEVYRRMIEHVLEHGADVNAYDNAGWQPLHVAIVKGNVYIMKLLIDAGADVEARTRPVGFTPMNIALLYQRYEPAKFLIELGAAFSTPKHSDGTEASTFRPSLFYHVWDERYDMVKLLLDSGFDPSKDGDRIPLSVAIEIGDYKFGRLLLEANAPITIDILRQAVRLEKSKVVLEILLKYGADFSIQDEQGNTVLHDVSDINTMQFLLDNAPGLARIPNAEGKYPLDSQCSGDNCLTSTALLLIEVAPEIADPERILPKLIEGGHVQLIKSVLEKQNTAIHAKYAEGNTLLHLASAEVRDFEPELPVLMRYLVGAGADITALNDNGETALHRAFGKWHLCGEKDEDAVAFLIDCGIDVHHQDKLRQAALHLAIRNHFLNGVQRLIDAGADVHARDSYGRTALHYAASRSIENVQRLIRAGADVSARDMEGRTPLHHAVERILDAHWHIPSSAFELLEAVRSILAASAADSCSTTVSQARIGELCRFKEVGIIKCLIDAGSNVISRDRHGNTAFDLLDFGNGGSSSKNKIGTTAGLSLPMRAKS